MTLLNLLPKDTQGRLRSLERAVLQLWGDVQRLLKTMPPEDVGSPSTTLNPIPDPFGTPDPGSGDGGSAFEWCTLVAPLWRGSSATATRGTNGETIAVHGAYFGGYGFDGESFKMEWSEDDQRWYAIGAGSYWEKGTLGVDLADGGSASLTVRSSKTITVWGDFGAVDSGKLVGASWTDWDQKWHVGDARC